MPLVDLLNHADDPNAEREMGGAIACSQPTVPCRPLLLHRQPAGLAAADKAGVVRQLLTALAAPQQESTLPLLQTMAHTCMCACRGPPRRARYGWHDVDAATCRVCCRSAVMLVGMQPAVAAVAHAGMACMCGLRLPSFSECLRQAGSTPSLFFCALPAGDLQLVPARRDPPARHEPLHLW